MYNAGPRVRMVDRHIGFPAAVTETRDRAVFLISDNALVDSRGIHRPGVYVRESVGCGKFHGIQDATVIPDLDTRIGPPIKAMTCVAPVVECGPLLEIIASWTQRELDTPLHAIGTIDIADPYRGAAVGFSCHSEIDGRNRHPIVRDRKVEFNSQRRPHTAIRDAGEFYGGIGIKH